MRRQIMMSRWFVGSFLTAGAVFAFPVAVPADDAKDNQKHGRRLEANAARLDAAATRASNTPDGQRRVTERIAKEFKVQPEAVTDLRSRLSIAAHATTKIGDGLRLNLELLGDPQGRGGAS